LPAHSSKTRDSSRIGELIIDLPGSLKSYKPDCAYLILDEGAYSSSDLEPLKNLVAAIFRLENATSREDIIRVVDHLIQWLSTPEQENIRQDFTIWIKRVLLPIKGRKESIQEINDLTEIRSMLAQTVSKMTEEWVMQGHTRGRIEGKIEGKIEGEINGEIKGEIKGEKIILLRLIQHRFGEAATSRARPLIDAIQSGDLLEAIGNWVIDCADAEEFLAKLRGI